MPQSHLTAIPAKAEIQSRYVLRSTQKRFCVFQRPVWTGSRPSPGWRRSMVHASWWVV